jgi:hypothetical protein
MGKMNQHVYGEDDLCCVKEPCVFGGKFLEQMGIAFALETRLILTVSA